MGTARDLGYDDLSFGLQTLDNTDTIGEVDRRLLREWAKQGKVAPGSQREAAAYLFRCIVDLQINGELIECGDDPSDRIVIHKDASSFISQFSVDARDSANRRAIVVCFGRMPRAAHAAGDDPGISLLREFLRKQGIKWTTAIKGRYLIACGELAKESESGPYLFGQKLRLPRLRIPTILGNAPDKEPVRPGPGAFPKQTDYASPAGKDAVHSGVGEKSSATESMDSNASQPAIPVASVADDASQTVSASATDDSMDIVPPKIVSLDEEKEPIKGSPQKEMGPTSTKPDQRDRDTDALSIHDNSDPRADHESKLAPDQEEQG
jgi:hypothetical protein